MPERHLVLPYQHIDQLAQTARQIIDFAGDEKVWLFEGAMGVGKTTLIKAICHALGVQDVVNSPTFALVNEYRNKEDRIFYHFDFYRINSLEEALNIGAEEYFYSGHHCFVEWPSQVESLIPERNLRIRLALEEDRSGMPPRSDMTSGMPPSGQYPLGMPSRSQRRLAGMTRNIYLEKS